MSGGHSGEEIPVPKPNTEVKLTNADDTAFRGGKVGSCQAFFLFNGEYLITGNPCLLVTLYGLRGSYLRRFGIASLSWFNGKS